jgi:rhamnose utilization protein RhaD (predicted bifunctional aldolase and dehydrogenase)
MATLITRDLIALSRDLGSPERGWAILGEGNTSAFVNDESFQVKRSGAQLSALTESDLVDILFQPLLAALNSDEVLDDLGMKGLLKRSKVNTGLAKVPSVETVFHAALLHVRGVKFVGHTHVTSINSLTCSKRGWDALCSGGRIFPDEIVVCGPAACCVEYADPGLPLARAIKAQVERYIAKYDISPKTIYLQNHGFIALGATAREVVSITQMADKAAQILLGALSTGEPKFMSDTAVERIYHRPDERVRQRELGLIVD